MPQHPHPVAVVTGAGSGIGRATCLLLARRGRTVVLAGRSRRPLEEAAAEIAAQSPQSRTLVAPTDVAEPDQVAQLIATTEREFGRLDILVNNAGRGELLGIDQTDLAALRRMFDTNAIGPALAIHHAWPLFTRQRSGCVINISTAGTHDPFPGFFAYAASKAAVNLFAKSCATEGGAIGVRAFAIAPGAVETPLLRSIFDTTILPPEACLSADEVALIILDCIEGRRDADNGRTILIRRDGDRIVELLL